MYTVNTGTQPLQRAMLQFGVRAYSGQHPLTTKPFHVAELFNKASEMDRFF
jgi:hypothetical protein